MATTHETQTSQTRTPEIHGTDQFERSRRELYGIVSDVESQYEAQGIDPLEVSKGNYWLAVADHATRLTNEKYSTEQTFEYGQLLQLTALAPAAFLAQRALKKLEHPSHGSFSPEDYKRRQNLVGIAVHYNDTVASYARTKEDLTAHELNTHLAETLEKTLEFPAEAVLPTVASQVLGIQQEVAAGYLLASGLSTRISSEEEDLQGADYIVGLNNRYGVMVDIKSSHHRLPDEDKQKGWTIKSGRIMVVSPLNEEDLNGKFYPTHKALSQKSPILISAVTQAMAKPGHLRKVPMI